MFSVTALLNSARTLGSLVMLGVILFFYTVYAQAGQVTLAWDANTESILGGYELSYGQASGNYTANVDVGKQTSYTLGSLTDGKTYYFAVKAYDSARTIQSGFSNEVSKTISSTTAPVASFSANPTSGMVPLTVTFTDTSTGNITGWSWNFGNGTIWSWNFGNGTTSTANTAAITYTNSGAYTASLTVTGPGGSNTASKTISATSTVSLTGSGPGGTNTKTGYITASSGGGGGGGNSGLVAAYNFEEISGTTVVDASSQGNHSTLSGAARTTQGRFGKALSFDGVNDWVTIKDAPSLDLTTGMTLEAWLYPTDNMSGWHSVLLKEDPPTTAAYYLYANSDSDQPATGFDRSWVEGGPWLAPNTWVHLAGTYDGTTQRLYVNGTEVANQPQSGSIAATDGVLRIGGDSIWGDYFKGRIDEVRIYNRALSASEIQTDMNRSVATSSPPILLVGTKTIGPVTDSTPQGQAEACQAYAGTTITGWVTSLSVYVDTGSTATKLVAGIYTDNNGYPGTRLAQGTLQSPVAGGWNKVPLPARSIKAGSTYWIAILSPSGVLQFRDGVSGASQLCETSAQTTLTALPSTWTTGTLYNEGSLSAYGAGY